MTKILRSLEELRKTRAELKGSVGFVPTMGALHKGHAELLKRAREENEWVFLSVFVNPTQFDNKEDLEKYPITLEGDIKISEQNRVNFIWLPTYPQLYPDHYAYKVTENELSQKFCGAHRPGHFDGVLSVVMKLLNLVKPHRAYFGEKDFQQLTLIQGMVKSFFLDVQIVPVPTVREDSGLALSSRNVRLSPEEREKAPELYRALTGSASAAEASARLQELGFKVDYVEDLGGRRLAAVYLGSTRLIDNVEI
ncbi:MAG: pantoate--beta-alanine ligase [Bdellovibrionales bacterium]